MSKSGHLETNVSPLVPFRKQSPTLNVIRRHRSCQLWRLRVSSFSQVELLPILRTQSTGKSEVGFRLCLLPRPSRSRAMGHFRFPPSRSIGAVHPYFASQPFDGLGRILLIKMDHFGSLPSRHIQSGLDCINSKDLVQHLPARSMLIVFRGEITGP